MTTAPRAFLLTDSADGALADAAEILQLDVVFVTLHRAFRRRSMPMRPHARS